LGAANVLIIILIKPPTNGWFRMPRLAVLAFIIRRIGVKAEEILSDGDDGLDARVRVQKIVYFLGQLGFGVDYDFDLYYHGPYSQALSNDYYTLAGLGDGVISELAELCERAGVCTGEMGSIIDGLNRWGVEVLEVASTIHRLLTHASDYWSDLNGVIDHVMWLKPWVREDHISEALRLLRSLGLMSD